MQWAGLDAPTGRPLVVFVDEGGGPLDQLAADADVTTFLNDRFTPIFLLPSVAPELPSPSVQVLDGRGCWLLPPTQPDSADAFIALANGVMTDLAAGRPATARPAPPTRWGVALPADSLLSRPCPAP